MAARRDTGAPARWTPLRALLAATAGAAALAIAAAPLAAAPASAATGADGRIAIAVVMPITVPIPDPIISSDDLATLTGPDGRLTRDLDAAAGQQVALAIDPRIIASIRVLGSAAPASAEEWLTRLAGVSNETFSLSYADADVVGPGQAGAADAIAPTGFDDLIDPSRFTTATSTASPSPTIQPGETPPLPTTVDDVIGWDWTITGLAWPAPATTTAADLPRLSAQGYTGVLLDEGDVAGGSGAHVDFADAPDLTGLVTDADLTQAIDGSAGTLTDEAFQNSLGTLQASLDAAAADAGGPHRVVTLSRNGITGVDRLPQVLGAIAASTNARLESLAAVRTSPATATTVADHPESADRIAAITETLRLAGLDAQYAGVAVDPADITSPRQRELLALLSVRWLGRGDWTDQVDAFADASRTLRNGVQLVKASDATALGANAPLPVTVRNTLAVPIRVYVTARPLALGLSIPADKRRVEVVVQPDSSQRVFIPSESVSNGNVRVEFSLASATGQAVGSPRVAVINVQAGWENIGTLVAVVLVLGVFGFGITRRILRGRRTRREGGGDAEPATDDAETAGTDSSDADDDAADDDAADPERKDAAHP